MDARLERELADLDALLELALEGEDVVSDLGREVERLEKKALETEIRVLLSGEHDRSNAIVTIHPGAGGTESPDLAEMLTRVDLRWRERPGHRTQVMDYQEGDGAGIKSATFLGK